MISFLTTEDAAFNVCKLLRKGATCNFTINSHSVPDVTGYKIEFGDGTSAGPFKDQSTVTPHVFANVGVYNVKLTFIGSTGPVTVTKTVTVKEALNNAVSGLHRKSISL